MVELKILCPQCGARVGIVRTWRKVELRCKSCGNTYPMERFAGDIDDRIDDILAEVPCDRI